MNERKESKGRIVHREPKEYQGEPAEACSECGKPTRTWLTPHTPLCTSCAKREYKSPKKECDESLISGLLEGSVPGYCPKCYSRLYPDDENSIEATGVCHDCVNWDKNPGRPLQVKLDAYLANKEKERMRSRRR